MQTIQIPPHKNDKESGIRGLKQIAEQVKNTHSYNDRYEIVDRYFTKFITRMNKSTPLTFTEERELYDSLMFVIGETTSQ